MNAGGRLGLYGAGLVVTFGAVFGIANAIAPADAADAWKTSTSQQDHGAHGAEASESGEDMKGMKMEETGTKGLSLSQNGVELSAVTAPAKTGEDGKLSFTIKDQEGKAVTAFETEHEKQLHLIVVRTDGTQFRHVHPELNASTGEWSIPWNWEQAGTYRVYTDFSTQSSGAVTLTRTVSVDGPLTEQRPEPTRHAKVDGYDVELKGDLAAGKDSELSISVSKDGQPVTTLQPYLGAYGHLVALRDGDLAYLHVHPTGDEPKQGETSGPDVNFGTSVPSDGRYLLYFDFQVDGTVRTAAFVVDAGASTAEPTTKTTTDSEGGHGHD